MTFPEQLTGQPTSAHEVPLQQILVVDDESMVRRFASRILTEGGYGVVEAGDGAEALDLVVRENVSLDLVLTDIMMPRLSGVELLEHLSVVAPGLPVVLMSGFSAGDLTTRGISVPCGLLAKPFPPDRLLDEVRRCLKQQGLRTGAEN